MFNCFKSTWWRECKNNQGNAVDLYAQFERAVYKEELFSETIYVAEVDSHVVGFAF